MSTTTTTGKNGTIVVSALRARANFEPWGNRVIQSGHSHA
jgi:hypothetical protein